MKLNKQQRDTNELVKARLEQLLRLARADALPVAEDIEAAILQCKIDHNDRGEGGPQLVSRT